MEETLDFTKLIDNSFEDLSTLGMDEQLSSLPFALPEHPPIEMSDVMIEDTMSQEEMPELPAQQRAKDAEAVKPKRVPLWKLDHTDPNITAKLRRRIIKAKQCRLQRDIKKTYAQTKDEENVKLKRIIEEKDALIQVKYALIHEKDAVIHEKDSQLLQMEARFQQLLAENAALADSTTAHIQEVPTFYLVTI